MSTQNRQNWANGLAAWDTLYLRDQKFLKKVNHWLGEEKLKTGYALKMKVYKEVDLESPIIAILERGAELDDIEILKSYMEKLPNKKRLFI
ncbi:MAG: hypothetical protein IPK14_12015 [Blastocatellia bacterium]|nr:hypothetical protein [Blastocatellia bacterium]